MTIAYEPMSDVLTITMQAAPVASTQVQGTVTVGFDAAGTVTSISIPDASSVLWENGGQVSVMLPTRVDAGNTTVIERTIVEQRSTLP
jgi:YD repeat-containing protein